MTVRDLDIVLFGATGFTGRLVAQRLAQRAPEATRIALAGRSPHRLEGVRDAIGPRAADWPIILADSTDPDSLRRMAQSTRVVATTVGPYLAHGLTLVEACATGGTHYLDLAGEVLFMRASIDAFDTTARATGARIVHACGFDSIPSDLGVLMLSGSAGGGLDDATLVVREARGGFSGGTVASGRAQAAAIRADPAAGRIAADPYALSPARSREPDLGDEGDLRMPVHDPELGWLAPFLMAPVNTRVVRRSNALAGYPYSRDFRYREAVGFGEGVSARVRAIAMAAGLGIVAGGLAVPGARHVLGRVLPNPGEGPSEAQRSAGRFRVEIHGHGSDGAPHLAVVAADCDPGYAATSLMLAEAALLAAHGGRDLPDRAGVLTPATAFGAALADRLRVAGMTLTAHPGPGQGR